MKKSIPILIGFIFVCLAVWLQITSIHFVRSFMERLDHLGYDLQLKTHILTKKPVPSSSVAIVDIDDKSLKTEGRWPWPRDKVAELVDKLREQGVTVIAFDVFFSEKEDNIAELVAAALKNKNSLTTQTEEILKENYDFFNNDAILAKSLSNSTSILALGFLPRDEKANKLPPPLIELSPKDSQQLYIMEGKGYISNIPILQKAAKQGGFINIFADTDGIIRHAPIIMEYNGNVYPSLALQAVITFLGQDVSLVTPTYHSVKKLEGIKVGATIVPTDETGQALIPFIGKSYTFPYYSATDVLHNNLPKDTLLGKIVFVGTSATGLGDLHATAIQNPFPGVEIQATLVNGILTDDFSIKPAWTYGANIMLTLLLGIIASFAFPYFGPRILGMAMILVPAGLLFINNWFWEETGIVISFILPVTTVLVISLFNIVYGYLFESRRREKLKAMFGQYVPEKHIDEMLKSTSSYALHGEDREMSVLFADIRGFTTISEGLKAAELVEMLNTFFTPMTEIIFKHSGTIDKYVGDLIMAFWGAPLKDKRHSYHAIQSALEMQEKVREMRPVIAERGWPEINIGIGINSGEMSVGDMGSRFRRNYTVLGDAVNLASRVESLTKFYGIDVMVTENTQQHQPDFVFRKLDLVRVKGKKSGVAIYEAICKISALTDALKHELASYHQALDCYFQQNWDAALSAMEQLHQADPDKKIYKLYIERISQFKENPPPADWDGVYIHTTK